MIMQSTLLDDDSTRANDNAQTSPRVHPSLYQKCMFWSLLVDIVFIPVWIVAGRTFLGGPGGWNGIVLMFTAAPIFCLMHIAMFVLAWRTLRVYTRGGDVCYYLSKRTCRMLCAYYIFHLFNQLFMDDGGDQGDMGSIMNHLGFPNSMFPCDMYMLTASAVILLAVAVLIQLACYEKETLEREGLEEMEEYTQVMQEPPLTQV